MNELQQIRCVACEGGIPPLAHEEIDSLLAQLNNWELSADNKFIHKRFHFSNFYKTMAFVNTLAWLAHQEDHHPHIQIGYNYCEIQYFTEAISGLSKNDFICAAKIDSLS